MLGARSRPAPDPAPVDILYLLVPLSLVLVFLVGAVFWWTLRSGQFDDLEGPAHRILLDDDSPEPGDAVCAPPGRYPDRPTP